MTSADPVHDRPGRPQPGARRAPPAHHRGRHQAHDQSPAGVGPRNVARNAIGASSMPSGSPSTRPMRTARSRSSTPPPPTFWGRRPAVGEEWCGSLRLLWPDGARCATTSVRWRSRSRRRGRSAAGRRSRVRPDGSHVSFMAYPTPLFDDGGQLIGAVNVLVDITERHRAEQALRASADALEASNAVKDEFLGLVSHELRTPVTTIFGNARLLQARGAELDDETAGVDDRRHRDRCRPPSFDHREPAPSDPPRVGHRGSTSSRRSSTGSSSARSPRSGRATRIGPSRSTSARPRAIVEADETLHRRCCSRTCSATPSSTARRLARSRSRSRRPATRSWSRCWTGGSASARSTASACSNRSTGPSRPRCCQRPRHRPGALPADRGRARRPDLGAAARRRGRGGRRSRCRSRRTRPKRSRPPRPNVEVRRNRGTGPTRSVRATSSPRLTEPRPFSRPSARSAGSAAGSGARPSRRGSARRCR